MRYLLPALVFFAPLCSWCLSAEEDDAEVRKWLGILGTNEEVRFQALNKLVQLGDQSIEPVRRVMVDRQQSVSRRWQAAKVLGALQARQTVPDLLGIITADDHPLVTRVAAEALGRIGDASVVPHLKQAIGKKRDPLVQRAIQSAVDVLEGRRPPRGPAARRLGTATHARKRDYWEQRFTWSESLAEGLRKARQQNRFLLTVVYAYESLRPTAGTLDRAELPYHVLLRGPFTDPDLTSLLNQHFVLAQVRAHLHSFSEDYPPPDPDPLAALGTGCRDVDPPALLISGPDGKLLHTVNALGVFNARLIHATLVSVLRANGQPLDSDTLIARLSDPSRQDLSPELRDARIQFLAGKEDEALRLLDAMTPPIEPARATFLKGKILHHRGQYPQAVGPLAAALKGQLPLPERHEALYLLADCEHSLRQFATATDRLRQLAKADSQTVWARKAAACVERRGPDLRLFESYAFSAADVPLTSTQKAHPPHKLAALVARAAAFLVHQQQQDGGWRTGMGTRDAFSTAAITAICTAALRDWHPTLPQPLQRQAEGAMDRGIRYVLKYSQRPGQAPSQVWNQTYCLELTLDLLADHPADAALRQAAGRLVVALAAHQYPGGGWSYLPLEFGTKRHGGPRPHSFNTGPILVELARAAQLGVSVPEKVIRNGATALASMRSDEGAFAYAPPDGFHWMTRQRAAIARDSICELGLLAANQGEPTRVVEAVKRFHHYRRDLEIPRKLYASYFNRNGHGAYFYTFGYYYAARALQHVPQPLRTTYARDLQNDLLAIVELDGTWIDSHASGKAYATAMALRALRQLERARSAGDNDH